jgi:hypothetical protein
VPARRRPLKARQGRAPHLSRFHVPAGISGGEQLLKERGCTAKPSRLGRLTYENETAAIRDDLVACAFRNRRRGPCYLRPDGELHEKSQGTRIRA